MSRPTCAVVLGIGVFVGLNGLVQSRVVAQQQTVTLPSDEASRLITLAQTWLGGVKRVAEVKSLELVGAAVTERVLFPDRYQLIEGGQPQTSFDSQTLWRRPPPPRAATDARVATLLAGVAALGPPSPDEQRRQGLRRVSTYAVWYLLRTLPTYPMTVRRVSEAACGVPGACLEFRSAEATLLFVAIDPATGQPRARTEQIFGPREPALQITLLDDYRVVNGLRVPYKRRTRFVMPDGAARDDDSQEVYQAIHVDLPLTPADFIVRDPN